MKRFVALVLSVFMVVAMLASFAMASDIAPHVEVVGCSRCGGACVVTPSRASNKLGECGSGIHYGYYLRYTCSSCAYDSGLIYQSVGHFCTGKGGHYCYSSAECDC